MKTEIIGSPEDQYIGSVFRRPVYWTSILALYSVYWLCFQETSILALFSGEQYIGSVFRRPVYWLCFQETIGSVFRRPVYWRRACSRLALFSETSILALFSADQYIGSCFQETSILALFSGDQYIGSCFQETSILALFSGDQYIGSCFQETSILALFSGDQFCFQETRCPTPAN